MDCDHYHHPIHAANTTLGLIWENQINLAVTATYYVDAVGSYEVCPSIDITFLALFQIHLGGRDQLRALAWVDIPTDLTDQGLLHAHDLDILTCLVNLSQTMW